MKYGFPGWRSQVRQIQVGLALPTLLLPVAIPNSEFRIPNSEFR
ncbi:MULTISPECIES: hypothetical protein [Chroococcidiopsis]|nr:MULTISPECIES: hypothetical protein [Chroococcidiopsis]